MRYIATFVFGLIVLGTVSESRAEIAVGSSLEWLTCKADLVVVGRLEKVVSVRGPHNVGNVVYHEVTVAVTETIRGMIEPRFVFRLDSYSVETAAVIAACLRSLQPTLLFLSRDSEGHLVPTFSEPVHPIFDLAAPGKYVFDSRLRVLALKEVILPICRDTAKKLAAHQEQHPNGRVVEKRIGADAGQAGEVLYSGSATFLIVPDFVTGEN